jgi:acyl-CoA thioesterase-1
LSTIIDRAQAKKAKVLLGGMYAPTSNGADYEKQVQEMFQTLAREKYVPLIPFFLEGVAGIESLNQQDGIHPNAEGEKIVVETVYKHLKPMLEAGRRK